MTFKPMTPLADQWELVPEQYKQLVREGKMSHAQALTYAVEKQEQPQQVAKKSLDPTAAPAKEQSSGAGGAIADKARSWYYNMQEEQVQLDKLKTLGDVGIPEAEKQLASLYAQVKESSQNARGERGGLETERLVGKANELSRRIEMAKKLKADPEKYKSKRLT